MTFNTEDEDLEKLDDSWINDFETNDKPYNELYKDNNFSININVFYINKANNIEKITEETFLLQKPNIISREEIIGIIKKKCLMNGNNYSLLSLIKYNITLNPEDIQLFLRTNNFDYYNDLCFTSLKNIDTIVFDKTIVAFQDLNTLFLLFYEKDKNKDMIGTMNNTRKIYLRSHHNTKHKKTIRIT
jgi:hypothetical protein